MCNQAWCVTNVELKDRIARCSRKYSLAFECVARTKSLMRAWITNEACESFSQHDSCRLLHFSNRNIKCYVTAVKARI